jgi:DNA-binding response OmpR family regulator
MTGILIVDDDPTIRTMFARALASVAETELASNGGEALRMLGAKKYALVLLDLHMPVIDGFVVLQTLAAKPGLNKDTPIYVVTADTSEQARIRALKRHAVFILTKPVPIVTLTALVDAALKKGISRQKERDAAEPADPPTAGRITPLPPLAKKPG